MLKLRKFNASDYERYPYVEDLCGEIVPRIAQVKISPTEYGGGFATVVVDANGIQVMIYDEADVLKMVFCRELNPFPLSVLVAENLEEPLDPAVLIRFGFEQFK